MIRGKDNIVQNYTAGVWEEREGDPFSFLQGQFVEQASVMTPSFLPFLGGAIGCLSYDLARTFEVLPEHAQDDLQFPDIYFLFVEAFVVIDYQMSMAWLVFSPSPARLASENWEHVYREGQARLFDLEAKLQTVDHALDGMKADLFLPNVCGEQSASEYQDRVRECQDFIVAGDMYQANLSNDSGLKAFMIISHHRPWPEQPSIVNCDV